MKYTAIVDIVDIGYAVMPTAAGMPIDGASVIKIFCMVRCFA